MPDYRLTTIRVWLVLGLVCVCAWWLGPWSLGWCLLPLGLLLRCIQGCCACTCLTCLDGVAPCEFETTISGVVNGTFCVFSNCDDVNGTWTLTRTADVSCQYRHTLTICGTSLLPFLSITQSGTDRGLTLNVSGAAAGFFSKTQTGGHNTTCMEYADEALDPDADTTYCDVTGGTCTITSVV